METKRRSASRWSDAAVSARMRTLKQTAVVVVPPRSRGQEDSSTAWAAGSAEQAA